MLAHLTTLKWCVPVCHHSVRSNTINIVFGSVKLSVGTAVCCLSHFVVHI